MRLRPTAPCAGVCISVLQQPSRLRGWRLRCLRLFLLQHLVVVVLLLGHLVPCQPLTGPGRMPLLGWMRQVLHRQAVMTAVMVGSERWDRQKRWCVQLRVVLWYAVHGHTLFVAQAQSVLIVHADPVPWLCLFCASFLFQR